jgi:hypothetical protein
VWDSKKIGKLGGKSQSPSKSAAARANGAKGGRPPKWPGKNGPPEQQEKYIDYCIVKAVARYKGLAYPDYFWSPAVNEKRLLKTLRRAGRTDLLEKLVRLRRIAKTQASKPAFPKA